MVNDVEIKPHRAHHVKYFKGIGYHPIIPLSPEKESLKSNLGHPCNFLVWRDGMIVDEPSENYPQYSTLQNIDTLIIKASSNIIVHKTDKPKQLDRAERNIACIADEIQDIGLPSIIVTGGAKGLSEKHNLSLNSGQNLLYDLWQKGLDNSYESLASPENIKRESQKIYDLLGEKIPIVNELGLGKFSGANDEVTKLIANYLQLRGRNILVCMATIYEGVHTSKSYGEKTYDSVIRVVLDTGSLAKMAHDDSSPYGTGGLIPKIPQIADMTGKGVNVVLFNGQYCNHDLKFQKEYPDSSRQYNPIKSALEGKVVGTRFISL